MADTVSVPAWIPVIAALGGGLVVGVLNSFNNWQNKKSEERKHHKELMLNVALEQWKEASVLCRDLLKAGRPVEFMPLAAYIVNLTTLSEILNRSSITKENIIPKLLEIDEINNEVERFFKEQVKTS